MTKQDFFSEFGKRPIGLAGHVGDGYFLIEMVDARGAHCKMGINMGGAAVGEGSDDFISSETYQKMLHFLSESELHKLQGRDRIMKPIGKFADDELRNRHKSLSPASITAAKKEIAKNTRKVRELQRG
jgi:hypothetical protein